ncbi:hypothetical protein CNY89_30210, partial [Amaricoccus sp. HAR-UPW-R2A-40]
GRGVFKPGVFEPGVFVDYEQQPDEPTARREMLDRLERLEQMIAPLVAQVGISATTDHLDRSKILRSPSVN